MKLKTLIKLLDRDKKAFQNEEVEFIVITKRDGKIIALDVERNARDIVEVLGKFGGSI